MSTIIPESWDKSIFDLPEPRNGKSFRLSELSLVIVDLIKSRIQPIAFYGPDEKLIGIYYVKGLRYVPAELKIKNFVGSIYQKLNEIGYGLPSFTELVKQVLELIATDNYQILRSEPLTIAFDNCILDWRVFLHDDKPLVDAIATEPTKPVFHYINYPLLYEYSIVNDLQQLEQLASQLCPKTLEAFKAWVGDNWPLLFEIIGYCLYPSYDLHKAIMLIGAGSNGKSTYLRLVRTILGDENVVSISLQDLLSNRFMPAQLYHKLANIYPDLPSEALENVGLFKALTGEDYITADRKYRDPIRFVNYAKLLFSANELPPIPEHTEAYFRRWILVEFPNKFEPDPTFFERTFDEKEITGCIVVALHAFKLAWKRRQFTGQEGEDSVRERWLRESDKVYDFIKTMIENGTLEEDNKAKVDRDALYELYQKWCDEQGLRTYDKGWFVRRLQALGYSLTRSGNKRYICGLKLNNSVNLEDWSLDELLGGD